MKKLCVDRKIWMAAGVLWMLFIWSNSLQTAAESSQKSAGVLELLAPLLERTGIPTDIWHTLIRKAAHMTEFALLGVLWSAALGKRGSLPERLGWVLLICLLTALADETIQLFVPGRSGELRDVWIDLAGSALGVVCFAVLRRLKANLNR